MKFNKKAVFAFLIAVILVISSFGNVLAQEETAPQEETKSEFSPVQLKYAIARVASQIASNYYYGVEDADLLYRALCSAIDNGSFDFDMAVERMMKALADEYSEFYPAERFEQVITDISGEFFGIGVSITLSDEHVVVVSVFPGSPAEKTGILPYDLIVSVDGQSIKGMSTAEVAALIKREKNSKVDLGIVRNGVPMTINCYCDEVDQNPVSYEIMEDGKIGYIYISNFTLNLDEFIVPILNEFNEKGIKDIQQIMGIDDKEMESLIAAAKTPASGTRTSRPSTAQSDRVVQKLPHVSLLSQPTVVTSTRSKSTVTGRK